MWAEALKVASLSLEDSVVKLVVHSAAVNGLASQPVLLYVLPIRLPRLPLPSLPLVPFCLISVGVSFRFN